MSGLPPVTEQVSPEYRAKCIQWALELKKTNISDKPHTASELVAAAKQIYSYVYGDK